MMTDKQADAFITAVFDTLILLGIAKEPIDYSTNTNGSHTWDNDKHSVIQGACEDILEAFGWC